MLLTDALQADEASDLKVLLEKNTYAIRLDGDSLAGPGAGVISKAAEHTQFVALGEEHYNLHIPSITTAIFAMLHEQQGYRYFMTEQDPVMMETFSQQATRGDTGAITKLAKAYPMGVTFNSDQELEMLAAIGRISDVDDVVWGCDQAAGATHALDQLLKEPLNETALADVREFRERAAARETDRNFKTSHFIYEISATEVERLKLVVAPEAGSRAEWLLDVLISSAKIFDFYDNGNNGILPGYYENNRYREEHLKDLCLAKYRQAADSGELPRTLMKFGSWHLYQGLSPTRLHTIGDFFSNIARFNDQEFLSIHFTSRPRDPEAAMDDIAFIWPFVVQLDADEFAIIDLRPFRRYPNRNLVQKAAGDDWLTANNEDFMRLVYGYDLIFYVGEHAGATFERTQP